MERVRVWVRMRNLGVFEEILIFHLHKEERFGGESVAQLLSVLRIVPPNSYDLL